jgi:hypothetical protein
MNWFENGQSKVTSSEKTSSEKTSSAKKVAGTTKKVTEVTVAATTDEGNMLNVGDINISK